MGTSVLAAVSLILTLWTSYIDGYTSHMSTSKLTSVIAQSYLLFEVYAAHMLNPVHNYMVTSAFYYITPYQ